MPGCPPVERLHVPERLARALHARALAYYPGEAGGLLYGRPAGGTLYISDYSDTAVRSGPASVTLRMHGAAASNAGLVVGSWHSHPVRGDEARRIPGPLLVAGAVPSGLDLRGALERAGRAGCWRVEAVVSIAPRAPGMRYVAAFYIVWPDGTVALGAIRSGG